MQHLNSFVFFRTGKEEGPTGTRQGHFKRYVNERPEVLSVPTKCLFKANPSPLFSRDNSGAPRYTKGKQIRRGPDTFVVGNAFRYPLFHVVEVVLQEKIILPDTSETNTVSPVPDGWKLKGAWQSL